MQTEVTPIQTAYANLPAIPALKRDPEERRGGSGFLPTWTSVSPVGVVGGTVVSPLRGMSLPAFLFLGLRRSGLLGHAVYAAVALLAGALIYAGTRSIVRDDSGEQAPRGPFFSAIQRTAAEPFVDNPNAGADALRMVVHEERQGAAKAEPAQRVEAAEAAAPTPSPAGPEAAAAPQASVPVAPALKDALAGSNVSSKLTTSIKERLAWSGAPFQLAPNVGGAFRDLQRAPQQNGLGVARRIDGRLSALRQASRHLAAGSHVLGGTAQRAMGQLKLAQRMSAAGARSGLAVDAKQGAADAFEQTKSAGGAGLSADAVPGTGVGASAPDITQSAPALPQGVNKTPYQKQADDAKKANDKTIILLIIGTLLLAAGAALLVYSHVLEASPDGRTREMGELLKKIAYGLLAAGALMMLLGAVMAMQAKQKAKDIGDNYGQKDQQAVVEQCTAQSLNKQACSPAAVNQPGNGVHDAVTAEGGAGYSLGAPAPTPAAGGPIAPARK